MTLVALMAIATACVDNTQKPATTTTAAIPTDYPSVPYEPPFADDTAWNTPASELSTLVDSERWVTNLVEGHRLNADDGRGFRISLKLNDLSVPIYYADADTPRRYVYPEASLFERDGFGMTPGVDTIPWDPSWRPSPGTDGEAVVIDGLIEYDMSRVEVAPGDCVAWRLPWPELKRTMRDGDLCVGDASISSTDIINGDAKHKRSKGMGAANLAGVLTGRDLASNGAIEHALDFGIYNTMFGPECDDVRNDTCGFYVEPATKLEWINQTGRCATRMAYTDEQRARTVPEGMRFVVDHTDAEIEQWLDERGYSSNRRETARRIAVALRDYGLIVARTTCAGSPVVTDAVSSPDLWAQLDATEYLMDGLIQPEDLRAVG